MKPPPAGEGHDEAAYRAFAESSDCTEIAKDRKAGTAAVVLLVNGIDAG